MLRECPTRAQKMATYQQMVDRLVDVVPDFELRLKVELVCEIENLKKERHATILAHNYMEPALFHTVADFKGDSLELSRLAAKSEADIIVFCGVRFMAETAKILNPTKMVLVPSQQAGCSLAESISAEEVRWLKRKFPGVPVVTYINTYADVKAESDYICTSGNAAAVVASLKADTVIFLPDAFLASNVAKETGKHILFPTLGPVPKSKVGNNVEPVMLAWTGKCEVHEKFSVEDIENVRKQFPDVTVLAHPECSPDVVDASDFTGSTSAMVKYVQEKDAPRYLLLTECSMGDNIIAENPSKEVLRLCSFRCPHMKEISLEQTRNALLYRQYEVNVQESIRVRAKQALDRMLSIG